MTEPEKNTLETEIEVSKEVSEVGEKIEKWNVGKISGLVEWIKKKFNIQETIVTQSVATVNDEKPIEKENSNVSIKCVEIGENLRKVLGIIEKAVKKTTGKIINTLDALKLTKSENKVILESVTREEAEDIKEQLEEAGAKIKIE